MAHEDDMPRTLALAIDPQLFRPFPALSVGALVATDVDRVSASLTWQELQRMWPSPTAARASTARLAAACEAIGARHLTTIGAHDVDALPESSVTLRAARPASDWFVPMAGRPTEFPLGDDVVVFAAGDTVLSWSFTLRDSRQTCLRPDTRCAVFYIEAVSPEQARSARAALEDLRALLARRGARVTGPAFVNASAPTAALTFEGAAVHS